MGKETLGKYNPLRRPDAIEPIKTVDKAQTANSHSRFMVLLIKLEFRSECFTLCDGPIPRSSNRPTTLGEALNKEVLVPLRGF